VLTVVAPYTLAARLAWQLLGVKISPMGVWNATQRLGEAAVRHSAALSQYSQYHWDSRSKGVPTQDAPPVVVLSVDGSMLGMQVRKQRRRRQGGEPLPPLPPVAKGEFQEVKALWPEGQTGTCPGHVVDHVVH
jgi:hypothetical protein